MAMKRLARSGFTGAEHAVKRIAAQRACRCPHYSCRTTAGVSGHAAAHALPTHQRAALSALPLWGKHLPQRAATTRAAPSASASRALPRIDVLSIVQTTIYAAAIASFFAMSAGSKPGRGCRPLDGCCGCLFVRTCVCLCVRVYFCGAGANPGNRLEA